VRVDRVAQIGGDALTEPGDHVEAQRRKHAKRGADREQREEVLAHRHHARARVGGDETLVDQRLHRDREDQRAERRHHQEQRREADPDAVRPQEGHEAAERLDVATGRRRHAAGGCRGRRENGLGGAGHARECRARRGPALLHCSAILLQQLQP